MSVIHLPPKPYDHRRQLEDERALWVAEQHRLLELCWLAGLQVRRIGKKIEEFGGQPPPSAA